MKNSIPYWHCFREDMPTASWFRVMLVCLCEFVHYRLFDLSYSVHHLGAWIQHGRKYHWVREKTRRSLAEKITVRGQYEND